MSSYRARRVYIPATGSSFKLRAQGPALAAVKVLRNATAGTRVAVRLHENLGGRWRLFERREVVAPKVLGDFATMRDIDAVP